MSRHWLRAGAAALAILGCTAQAQDDPALRPASAALAAQFSNWQFKFEPGAQEPRRDKGLFAWHSNPREGSVRLVSRAGQHRPVSFDPVAARRCLSDRRKSNTEIAKNWIIRILGESNVAKYILDDLRVKRLSYADLNNACVQQFEASLGPSGKTPVRTIMWHFERRTETEAAGVDVWSIFAKDGEEFRPRYLVRIFDPLETPSDLFEVLAVSDLNGDGVDEWIVRALAAGPEGDHLLIVSWENEQPVVVHDTDQTAPAGQPRPR